MFSRCQLVVGLATASALCGMACAQSSLSFVEATSQAGLEFAHAPLLFDEAVSFMSGGGAVGDFNNDGWQDLFVLATGVAPDRLYINNGDGTFTDRAAAWGIAETHLGMGAAVADYDRDGLVDIYVTSHGIEPNADGIAPGMNRLYKNLGTSFENVAEAAGVHRTSPATGDGFGAAFGDYDLDGDLDLAVAGWRVASLGNVLFRNNGDGTFDDVTQTLLGQALSGVRGFSPRFADMNGDRYPELLWVSDFGTSKYLHNQGGSFVERTAAAGVGLEGNGMGVAVGDFNNDGRLDYYATSIYDGPNDPPNPWDPPVSIDGNMLYMNLGNSTFAETSLDAGVRHGHWGWGALAVDLDHDGLTDIAATNGWQGFPWENRPSTIFLNNGDGTFRDETLDCGFLHFASGRGLVRLDHDNDGDQDLVVFSNRGDLQLFSNEPTGPSTNWLRIFFDTTGSPSLPPNGIGTRVHLTTAGTEQYRDIDAGPTYLTQSEASAHFGVADAGTIDELRIRWSRGWQVLFTNIPANQTITIRSCPCEFDGNGAQRDVRDLLAYLDLWFDAANGVSFDNADLSGDGAHTIVDLLAFLDCYLGDSFCQ